MCPYISKRKICTHDKLKQKDVQDRRKDRWGKYYNDKRWKHLREWFVSTHYLCHDCAIEGRSIPGEEVHHKVVFSWFDTEEDRIKALLDPDNLVFLCKSCHLKRHKNLHKPDNFEQTEEYKKIHNM